MFSETLFLWLAFCWLAGAGLVYRSWSVWRQTGIHPIVLPRDDSPQGWIGRQFRVVLLVSLLLLSLSLWWPMPALWDLHGWQKITEGAGWLLLLAACVLMPVAQHHMGQAWRVGFSGHEHTPLITRGVFSRSRNPVFLALRLAMWAWLLIQPTAWSLALCLLADTLMQIQVRLEEEHLTRQHGAAYALYRQRVRRWI